MYNRLQLGIQRFVDLKIILIIKATMVAIGRNFCSPLATSAMPYYPHQILVDINFISVVSLTLTQTLLLTQTDQ